MILILDYFLINVTVKGVKNIGKEILNFHVHITSTFTSIENLYIN